MKCGMKKRGWSYLCRKHYYQEQKHYKGKLPWSTVATKDGEIDSIRNTSKNVQKTKLIKRLKKRLDEVDKYIANGGKMHTWKDLKKTWGKK